MISRLYKPLWLVLQLIVTVYEALCWLGLRLQAVTLWSYDLLDTTSSINSRRDRAFLQRCKKQLTKVPQHLNIIIGPDCSKVVDEKTISLISWYALIIGINYISIYDTRPEEKGRTKLKNLPVPAEVCCTEIQQHHYVWRCEEVNSVCSKKKTLMNGYTSTSSDYIGNGHTTQNCLPQNSTKSCIEIYEINSKDSRPLIAEVCRELFLKRTSADVQGFVKNRKELEQCISEQISMHLKWKFSDPELSIIFYPHTSTFGMLPWQTRFTEICTFDTGRYVNAKSFAKILYRYSRCEQRWGK